MMGTDPHCFKALKIDHLLYVKIEIATLLAVAIFLVDYYEISSEDITISFYLFYACSINHRYIILLRSLKVGRHIAI